MNIFLKYKNIIVSVAVVVFFIFIAKGIYVNYTANNSKFGKRYIAMKKKMVLAIKLHKLNTELRKLGKKPFSGDLFGFKKVLEDNADKLGVIVQSFKPSVEKDERNYKQARINMVWNAGYRAITDLIGRLESTGYVEVVSFSRQGSKSFRLVVKVFFK